ncbi:hypothetical protein AXF42_Ash004967 [Apostasia shenzhenica]|uniref:Uncharacterized protein n=1 Tax=Apostasia shenzhenica TaxID=1088818 RepID=A0A2I0B835_9ASPA|nr:hypothetical protein AXF42_Ash004967 [Apostasia shenzhenica]
MVGKRELPLPQLKFESLQGAQMEFTVWGYPSSVIFAVGSNLENLEVTLDVKPGEFILRTWLLHPSNSK